MCLPSIDILGRGEKNEGQGLFPSDKSKICGKLILVAKLELYHYGQEETSGKVTFKLKKKFTSTVWDPKNLPHKRYIVTLPLGGFSSHFTF